MEAMFAPLQRYADFEGRSNRNEYWLFTIGVFLASLALDFLSSIFTVALSASHTVQGRPLAALLYLVPLVLKTGLVLGTIIPNLAVLVRRLHDTNRTGRWALLLIPVFLMVLVGGLMGFIVNQSYFGNARAAWALLRLVSPLMPFTAVLAPVAFVCALTLFVFTVLKGTADTNRFGPPPGSTLMNKDIEPEMPSAPVQVWSEQSHPVPLAPPSAYRPAAARAVFGKRG